MREWLDEWLELCAHRGLRPSTVASYETMLRLHVGDDLGTKELESVTAHDLNQLYGHLLREGRRDGGVPCPLERFPTCTRSSTVLLRCGARGSPRCQPRSGRGPTVAARQ